MKSAKKNRPPVLTGPAPFETAAVADAAAPTATAPTPVADGTLASGLVVAGVATPPAEKPTTVKPPAAPKSQTLVYLILRAAAKAAWRNNDSKFHQNLGHVVFPALLISAAQKYDAEKLAGQVITAENLARFVDVAVQAGTKPPTEKDVGNVAIIIDAEEGLNDLGKMIYAHRAKVAAQRGNGSAIAVDKGDTATRINQTKYETARRLCDLKFQVAKRIDAAADFLEEVRGHRTPGLNLIEADGMITAARRVLYATLGSGDSAVLQQLIDTADRAGKAAADAEVEAVITMAARNLATIGPALDGAERNAITVALAAIDSAYEAGEIKSAEARRLVLAATENLNVLRIANRTKRDDRPRDNRPPRRNYDRDDRSRGGRPARFAQPN